VQPEGVAPERLVTEGIEAEGLPALIEQLLGGLAVLLVRITARGTAHDTLWERGSRNCADN
jgi:hypothetical protein